MEAEQMTSLDEDIRDIQKELVYLRRHDADLELKRERLAKRLQALEENYAHLKELKRTARYATDGAT